MSRPLRYRSRLAAGDGMFATENTVFEPLIDPDGTSFPAKDGSTPPPPDPHAPELPSTRTQSLRLPAAPSIWPDELITAARPTVNPAPSSGRNASSFSRPVTSAMVTAVVTGTGP